MIDTTRPTSDLGDLLLAVREVRDAAQTTMGVAHEAASPAYRCEGCHRCEGCFRCHRCEGCFRCFRCEGCHRCEGGG